MSKGIFITATGTDVGKTYVSALIVKKMRDLGFNCGYYKPVLSGAKVVNNKMILGDCQYVFDIANIKENPNDFVSYAFELAVSPHLASEIAKNPIELEKIKNDFNIIKSEYEYLVVEGAGGIVCPFNLGEEKILLPDVIKALNLDIVIIASASLGTINSTVLTVEYAKQIGINIKGIILNNFDEKDFMQVDNKKQVENLTGVKVIATIKENDKEIEDISSIFKEI